MKGVKYIIFSFFISTLILTFAEDIPWPVLQVPKMSKPPIIDGKIQKDEWNDAAAFTGVSSLYGTLVPEVQQVTWYIGYDDENLYLAMHSPHQIGTYPLAKCKEDDNGLVLFEDHVEIQLTKYPRNEVGGRFFKLMINPRGALIDQHYGVNPGQDGIEWQSDAVRKCTVEKDHWDLELAIPIKSMTKQSLDNKNWLCQLVRSDTCGGIYFCGWVPASWMEWTRFAEVKFSPESPAFQFLKLGEITRGEIDALFAIKGMEDKPEKIEIKINILDKNKKIVYQEKKEIVVNKDERKEITFSKKDIPLSDTGNIFQLIATGNNGSDIIYAIQSPVIKMTDEFYKTHILPWLENRPKTGEPEFKMAYYPSYGGISSSVDLDFYGMPEEIMEASKFALILKDEKGNIIAKGENKLENYYSSLFINCGKLPGGKYNVDMILYGKDGKTIVSNQKCSFVRKYYPWEGNKIGISDKVIPPYSPLTHDGFKISPWGRTYKIGKNGLPEEITILGENILAKPITLIGKQKGKIYKLEPEKSGSSVQFISEKLSRYDLQGKGILGSIPVEISSYIEYDGWYQIKLTFTPKRKTTIDNLDLLINFWNGADTAYIQRADGRIGSFYNAIPKGKGILWESTSLPGCKNIYKSFVPQIFIGNGDKGLWWFADSWDEWVLDDRIACVSLEREGKTVRLRLRIFATPTVLEKPKTIEFAFLPSPVKPMEKSWRQIAWFGGYGHDTTGYRYYGDSVDGFALHTEEDFEGLKKHLATGKYHSNSSGNVKHNGSICIAYQKGQPYVLYGSTWMTGMGMDEFDTFGGEWLGITNWKPNPDTTFYGDSNYGGTIIWDTPRELSPTAVNFNRSFMECFIWYHKKLVEKCRLNGTWWDNSSIGLIWDIDPKTGEKKYRWNTFLRRELTKRLATMCWELGVEPWWIMNMHIDFSWCKIAWHVENDFYVSTTGMDQIDQLSPDEFRSLTRTKGGIIHRLWTNIPDLNNKETPESIKKQRLRSIQALLFTHDIGTYWGQPTELLQKLNDQLKFLDDGINCEFIGYWRSKPLVSSDKQIHISIYRNLKLNRAAIVVMNAGSEPVKCTLTINPKMLMNNGKTVIKKIYDVENPEDILTDPKNGSILKGIEIPRHDFRILLVETERRRNSNIEGSSISDN